MGVVVKSVATSVTEFRMDRRDLLDADRSKHRLGTRDDVWRVVDACAGKSLTPCLKM